MIAHEELALRHRFAPTPLRPPHPRPTFATMANAPLSRAGMGQACSADLLDGASDISDFPNYAPVLRRGPRQAVRCDLFSG